MKRTLLLFALVVAGCGSPNTPGEDGNISGTWTGSYSTNNLGLGAGTASLSLVQTGSAVSGTWRATPINGTSTGGTVSGTNGSTRSDGTFTIDLNPSDPRSCPFRATMTYFLNQNQMTGDFVTFNCTVAANGVLILRKAF